MVNLLKISHCKADFLYINIKSNYHFFLSKFSMYCSVTYQTLLQKSKQHYTQSTKTTMFLLPLISIKNKWKSAGNASKALKTKRFQEQNN